MKLNAVNILVMGTVLIGLTAIKTSTAQNYIPTYYTDVQVILEKHCTACHVAGGIAPFVLDSGAAATKHAKNIARVVQQGTMPPWQPGEDSPPFLNDPRLGKTSKQMLLDWEKSGAPLGKPLAGQKP